MFILPKTLGFLWFSPCFIPCSQPQPAHHVHGAAVQMRHGAVVQLLGGVRVGAEAAQVVADHLGTAGAVRHPPGEFTRGHQGRGRVVPQSSFSWRGSNNSG